MKTIHFFPVLVFVTMIAACTPVAAATPTVLVEPSILLTATMITIPSKVVVTETSTSTQVPTLTATLMPTPTSTPVPTLMAHTWQAETVLVRFEAGGGDSFGCCQFPYPPELILYADGRLIVVQDYEVDGEWRTKLLVTQLNREQVCAFLNTVDQIGFLDYDPSTYAAQSELSSDGGTQQRITVNSWKQKMGTFYDLGSYVMLDRRLSFPPPADYPQPIIPPALRNMYYLLRSYFPEGNEIPAGMEIYTSENLGILAGPDLRRGAIDFPPKEDWPFESLSLAEIYKATTVTVPSTAFLSGYETHITGFYVLHGKEAQALYEFLGPAYKYKIFTQDGVDYYVFARPLLPYESPLEGERPYHFPDDYFRIIPDPKIKPPSITLSCSPVDGILPIIYPTPW